VGAGGEQLGEASDAGWSDGPEEEQQQQQQQLVATYHIFDADDLAEEEHNDMALKNERDDQRDYGIVQSIELDPTNFLQQLDHYADQENWSSSQAGLVSSDTLFDIDMTGAVQYATPATSLEPNPPTIPVDVCFMGALGYLHRIRPWSECCTIEKFFTQVSASRIVHSIYNDISLLARIGGMQVGLSMSDGQDFENLKDMVEAYVAGCEGDEHGIVEVFVLSEFLKGF
jgi:hypothetical protein